MFPDTESGFKCQRLVIPLRHKVPNNGDLQGNIDSVLSSPCPSGTTKPTYESDLWLLVICPRVFSARL